MDEFKDCIDTTSLTCVEPVRGWFTWSGNRGHGRVWRRLDRIFVNTNTLASFSDLQCQHLSKTTSDHNPLLLECTISTLKVPKSFRFLHSWLAHPTFQNLVATYWSSAPSTGGMRGLINKLKGLKSVLREWNTNTFGNIFQEVRLAEEAAITAELAFDENPCRNSKLTMKHIKAKDGRVLSLQQDIQQEAIQHFTESFSKSTIEGLQNILQFIPSVITDEDNHALSCLPTIEEVRDAIWDLDPHSTSGPDGYTGEFFRKTWEIVGSDILKAAQEFFLGIPTPKAFGATLITLIPKSNSPKSFNDYRPISLSTFVSKIHSKLLAKRLKGLLYKLISHEQGAFQQGKDISDQILLTTEMLHALDRKVNGDNLIIKVDMAKAVGTQVYAYVVLNYVLIMPNRHDQVEH
ncbi:unnamed protein product [Cuscuta campestris]|uniref:Uncharacterized protein n=1 Tax=Cuscuta campestris TaxID=132261 RepID=A0A484MQH4_9ASTE|nr:unnamed protein product [Cuscuta campestris]